MTDWSFLTKRKFLRDLACVLVLRPTVQGFVCGQGTMAKDRVYLNSKGELTSRTIRRNMKRFEYDDGGSFICREFLLPIKRSDGKAFYQCRENDVRNFIWNHLTANKRGYIRITYAGVDAGSIEHIFIEPGENGTWQTTWWTVEYSWLHRRKVIPKGRLLVERIHTSPNGVWRLHFTNAEGIVLARIPSTMIENVILHSTN